MKLVLTDPMYLSGTPQEIAKYVAILGKMSESSGNENHSQGAIGNAPTPNMNPNDLFTDLGQLFGGMINNESNKGRTD